MKYTLILIALLAFTSVKSQDSLHQKQLLQLKRQIQQLEAQSDYLYRTGKTSEAKLLADSTEKLTNKTDDIYRKYFPDLLCNMLSSDSTKEILKGDWNFCKLYLKKKAAKTVYAVGQ